MKSFRHFEVSKARDVLVIRLVDAKLFDTMMVSALHDELLVLIHEERPRKVVINFDRVSQCSTSVINALLTAKKRLREIDGDVKLCRMSETIREAYQLLKLDGTVFHIHDTEAESIAAFGYVSR